MAGSSHPLRDSALLALYGKLLAEIDHTTDPRRAAQLRGHIATVERAMERLKTKLRDRRIRRAAALRALDEQLADEIKNTIEAKKQHGEQPRVRTSSDVSRSPASSAYS